MVAALSAIAAQASVDNMYVGDARARRLRAQLAALPKSAVEHERVQALKRLASAELRLGHEQEAIKLLSAADQLLGRTRGRDVRELAELLKFQLGVAYLRLGETQNCCQQTTPDSCILPIRGSGVHARPEGSRRAIEYFAHVLGSAEHGSRKYLESVWLLNIAYMTIGGYPDDVPEAHRIPPEVFQSEAPFTRFVNVAKRVGLDTFSNLGGAVADDFDKDGYLDVMVCSWDVSSRIRLFRNNANGTFSEVTEAAGLMEILGGCNMVQADYNNDGHLDVFVLRGGWFFAGGRHPNSLLRNQGDGTFVDVTFDAGLADKDFPTQSAAWSDFDHDGDLDLYVGNESTRKLSAPSNLFRNNGDGTFTDVAHDAGVTNDRLAKAVCWGDYDGDRWPDLYVSNYGAPNGLYRNKGDGTFTDVAQQLGVSEPVNSFPAWFWDFDNDGMLDLYVSAYEGTIVDVAASYLGVRRDVKLPRLYRRRTDGNFEDVALERNLTRPTLPMGANFGDLDNDGWLDFYLGTGWPDYEQLMPNVMYHNKAGQRFADVTFSGGFGHLQKGHAVAFADFDNDGDQDVFQQMGGAYAGDKFYDALFENPGFGNHWICVRLVGVESNRSAIGARLHVVVDESGRRRSIYKYVNSGGSFGANPLRQTIGIGAAEKIDRLEVFWPRTGKTQTFREVAVDQFIELREGADHWAATRLKRLKFAD
jgi:hypothetical protein